jgi:hypothetical protein
VLIRLEEDEATTFEAAELSPRCRQGDIDQTRDLPDCKSVRSLTEDDQDAPLLERQVEAWTRAGQGSVGHRDTGDDDPLDRVDQWVIARTRPG